MSLQTLTKNSSALEIEEFRSLLTKRRNLKSRLDVRLRNNPLEFYWPHAKGCNGTNCHNVISEHIDSTGYKYTTRGCPQYLFHTSLANTRLFLGSNQSGKTTCGIVEDLFHFTGLYPFWYPKQRRYRRAVKGRILANDFKKAVGEVITQAIDEWLPKFTLENRTKNPQGIYDKYFIKHISGKTSTFDIVCLRSDQRILLSDGREIPIKNIKIGDNVKCKEGNTKVKRIFQSYDDIFYEIRTTKGNKIICTYKHPIFTDKGFIRACDLKIGNKVIEFSSYKIKPSFNIEDWEAFLLGLLLGDGHIKGFEVKWTCFSKSLVDYVKNILPKNLQVKKITENEYRISQTDKVKNNPIKKLFTDLGIWGKLSAEKYIPDEIFRLSNDKIAIVLKGLFSADGAFGGHCLRFSSRSERMMDDVKKLLRRFNIVSRVYGYYRENFINGYDASGFIYQCQISASKSMRLFAKHIGVVGKKINFDDFIFSQGKSYERENRISSIKIIKGGDCLDIEVDSQYHNYIVDGFIVHNTYEQKAKVCEGWVGDFCHYDEPPPKGHRIASARGLIARMGWEIFTLTPLREPWIFDSLFQGSNILTEYKN